MGTLVVPDYLTAACESVRVGHRAWELGVAEVRSTRTRWVFSGFDWSESMKRIPFDSLIEMFRAVDGKGDKIQKYLQDNIADLEKELAATKILLERTKK